MPDINWLVPAAIFVALQYMAAFAISSHVAFAPRPPIGTYMLLTGSFAFAGAAMLTLFTIARLAISGEDRPIARLRDYARTHWKQWIAYVGAFFLFGLQIGALTWLKVMIPHLLPFWADPMLARADRWLLGDDAWVIARRLFGPFDRLIDATYLMWFPVKSAIVVIALIRPPSMAKATSMLAYFLTVGLFGVVGQYVLSSAGPIFFERLGLGNQFDLMPVSPMARQTADYLWAARLDPNAPIGGGISAMPSIHVATSMWMVLAAYALLPRIVAVAAAGFAALIFVGSVFLGWHYLVDSIAGVAAALISWWIARLYLKRFVPTS